MLNSFTMQTYHIAFLLRWSYFREYITRGTLLKSDSAMSTMTGTSGLINTLQVDHSLSTRGFPGKFVSFNGYLHGFQQYKNTNWQFFFHFLKESLTTLCFFHTFNWNMLNYKEQQFMLSGNDIMPSQ